MSTLHSPAGSALDALYRAHVAEVYRYAYAVLGNRADAEDVTQTTFVNALRALERGEQPRKPANWLITIAHNLIRQRFRQKAARPSEVALDRDVAAPEESDGPSLDELVRALQRIPESQREALVLRELEGRPYREIAGILGVSVTALETLIFRARRSLAEELENLVTCDRAELALSQQADRRLGRKERRRLAAHLEECTACARVAARSLKQRRAFKSLAVLPLPLSLGLYGGGPTAAAAASAGLAAKVAAGVAAVVVIGGAGYEGAQAIRDDGRPAARPAAVSQPRQEPVLPIRPFVAERQSTTAAVSPKPEPRTKPKPKPAAKGKGPVKPKPVKSIQPARGKSAGAPGQLRPKPAQAAKKKRR